MQKSVVQRWRVPPPQQLLEAYRANSGAIELQCGNRVSSGRRLCDDFSAVPCKVLTPSVASRAGRAGRASELEAAPVEEERSEERTLWDGLNAPNVPKWGTPEARMREMLRLQRRIDELRRRKKEE